MEMMVPILMVIVFSLLLLEVLLSGRWNPTYFRKGIPIFFKRYEPVLAPTDSFQSETLTEAFKGWLLPPLVFKKIGPDEYAFREGLFQLVLLTYLPLMHGILQVDRGTGIVTVVGHVNWVALIFFLAFVAFGWSAQFFALFPLFSIIVALYVLQAYRFHKVGRIVSEGNSDNGSG